jgi:hypothetical protein
MHGLLRPGKLNWYVLCPLVQDKVWTGKSEKLGRLETMVSSKVWVTEQAWGLIVLYLITKIITAIIMCKGLLYAATGNSGHRKTKAVRDVLHSPCYATPGTISRRHVCISLPVLFSSPAPRPSAVHAVFAVHWHVHDNSLF